MKLRRRKLLQLNAILHCRQSTRGLRRLPCRRIHPARLRLRFANRRQSYRPFHLPRPLLRRWGRRLRQVHRRLPALDFIHYRRRPQRRRLLDRLLPRISRRNANGDRQYRHACQRSDRSVFTRR
jgi:hypothetical protein